MSETAGDARAARILVIKLGALGDFVQALGPCAAIRRHHAGAHIVLLTTAPFEELARASGLFDEIWRDDKPGVLAPGRWLALRRRLRAGGFARVYDLQTSDRSGFYYRLLGPGRRPEWSGIARGCSHPHADPRRDFMHTLERQAGQLAAAGIAAVPPPDLSWAAADPARFGLDAPFALLVPGGARHRPGKRWPAASYGALAAWLTAKGVRPAIVGTADEKPLVQAIAAACPMAVDLAGRTSLVEVAGLARAAFAAVGNDTGPMHLTAAAGCPSVVLFSRDSDPALCAPRGAKVEILRSDPLAALGLAAVLAALSKAAGAPPAPARLS